MRTELLRRIAGLLAIGLLAGGLLAGCGKQGSPKPPAGDDAPYPRTYPSEG